MDGDALVPAEDVNSDVVFLFDHGDLCDGRGGIDPFEFEAILGGVLGGSLGVFVSWEQDRPEGPAQAVAILILHIDNHILIFEDCGQGYV